MSEAPKSSVTPAPPDESPVDRTAPAEATPETEIAALREELDRANDRALRLQAEMENVRRRLRRELDDERQYAALPIMRDLLPVVDNLARAIEAAQKTESGGGLLEGVQMLAQQLDAVLAAHHCKRIEALHQPFDPNLHDAILQQPSPDHPPGTVIFVAQPGYQLFDRVVRPAQVIVSS